MIADGLAGKLVERSAHIREDRPQRIRAALHGRIEIGTIPRQGKDMHESFLDDGVGGVSGDVLHRYAAGLRSLQVDIVHSGSGFADQLEGRSRGNQLRIDYYLVDNEHVAIAYARKRFLARGSGISDKLSEGGYFGQRCIAYGRGVQKNDLHGVKF